MLEFYRAMPLNLKFLLLGGTWYVTFIASFRHYFLKVYTNYHDIHDELCLLLA